MIDTDDLKINEKDEKESEKDEKESEKEAKVKVKVLDKVQVRHAGKIYHSGDTIEMSKPDMERLKKFCKIEEVKK